MPEPGTATVIATQPAALGAGAFVAPVMTCIVAFAAVIGLIFLSRYVLKFMEPYLSRGRQTPNLAVMESVAVDPRRRVSVIRYGQKKGLVLTGGSSDVFMGWVDEGDAPVAPLAPGSATPGSAAAFPASAQPLPRSAPHA
ncbi:flagellar biosynthetic protein FliO [Acetobacter sp. LMG 32666]|uniref:flagellar biosynthetic protein FliO n=1 Tax=Acetobacter sp. LMG 32666 TaxID=2959295 RepID=UPI0030C88E68